MVFKNEDRIDRYRMDVEIQGMAVVLGAYKLFFGAELSRNFRNLTPDDLEQVRAVMLDTIPPAESKQTILDEVLFAKKIPEQHLNLITFINEAINYPTFVLVTPTRKGAVAMFSILSHFWPKLSQTIRQPELPPQSTPPDLQ